MCNNGTVRNPVIDDVKSGRSFTRVRKEAALQGGVIESQGAVEAPISERQTIEQARLAAA
jgi:hypothetical protein